MLESQWKLKISDPSLTIFVILGNQTLKYLDFYLENWNRDNINLLRLLNVESKRSIQLRVWFIESIFRVCDFWALIVF